MKLLPHSVIIIPAGIQAAENYLKWLVAIVMRSAGGHSLMNFLFFPGPSLF